MQPEKRRVGRPARLDRAAIARASAELSLDEVSMRSVADRLGVSVPSLYHYVRGRDELIRMAVEQSAARLSVPDDHGQHWAEWLYQWADHARVSFAASPALLEQFLHGRFGLDRMVDSLDAAFSLLMKQGFAPREAQEAFALATGCAVGAAVAGIRERAMADAGLPLDEQYEGLLANRPDADLPHLRAVLRTGVPSPQPFPEQMATVLAGIAARRGDDWRAVVALVLPAGVPGAAADRPPADA